MDTTHEHMVGDLIRRTREGMKLSRRKVAATAGVSESRLRQIENGVQYKGGEAQPATTKAETLVRIARALNMEAVELLEAAGFPPEAAEVVTEAPPLAKGNVIDLNDFPDYEAELIRTFASGLKLGRTGRGKQ